MKESSDISTKSKAMFFLTNRESIESSHISYGQMHKSKESAEEVISIIKRSNEPIIIEVVEKSAYDKAVEALKEIEKHSCFCSIDDEIIPQVKARETLRELGVE